MTDNVRLELDNARFGLANAMLELEVCLELDNAMFELAHVKLEMG